MIHRQRTIQSRRHTEGGVALLYTILLAGILLTMVLTLSGIFLPKLRTASDFKNSNGAIYAAESAAEWCLYRNRIGAAAAPVMQNGATYTLTPPDCSTTPVRAVGTYNGVSRAYEVDF